MALGSALSAGNILTVPSLPSGVPDGTEVRLSSDGREYVYNAATNFWSRRGIGSAPMASPRPNIGELLTPASTALTTFTFVSGNNGIMWTVPLDVLELGPTYDRAWVGISAGFTAGVHTLRFGLYRDDGTLTGPDLTQLVADWGDYTLPTGTSPGTGPTISYAPDRLGRIWLAMAYRFTGTPTTYPTMTVSSGGQTLPPTGLNAAQIVRALSITGVSGALPTSGTMARAAYCPNIGLRRAT